MNLSHTEITEITNIFTRLRVAKAWQDNVAPKHLQLTGREALHIILKCPQASTGVL